ILAGRRASGPGALLPDGTRRAHHMDPRARRRRIADQRTARLPEAKSCSMRAQLLLLPRYAGAEVAEDARDAWFGLARATHHHAYELAPTAAELRTWHDLVSKITKAIGAGGLRRERHGQKSTAGFYGFTRCSLHQHADFALIA